MESLKSMSSIQYSDQVSISDKDNENDIIIYQQPNNNIAMKLRQMSMF